MRPKFAKAFKQHHQITLLYITAGRSPIASSFAAETLPTPGIFASGKVCKNAGTSAGVITNWPLGLFMSEGDFGEKLTGATPRRRRQLQLVENRLGGFPGR